MAVGNIYEPDHANSILAAGRADLVALARPHLIDPFWTLRAAAQLDYRDVHVPPQYLNGMSPARPQPEARGRSRRGAQGVTLKRHRIEKNTAHLVAAGPADQRPHRLAPGDAQHHLGADFELRARQQPKAVARIRR